MKKHNTKRFLGGMAISLFWLMAGCSDGVLSLGGVFGEENPLPPPTIKDFKADPVTVEYGGSTTLSWEVSEADKVEIASTSATNKFSYSTDKDFKSKTIVEGLKETTTFILTATKEAPKCEGEACPAEVKAAKQTPSPEPQPAPAPEGAPEAAIENAQVVKKSVTVTVKGSGVALNIEEFFSESPAVDVGEQTILHWSVVPEEAVINIKASTGEPPVQVDCGVEASTTKELESETGEVVENFKPQGCATVSPTEDTVYTLEAKLGEVVVSKELSVAVNTDPKVDLLTVNGVSSLKVTSYPQPVELAWKARPKSAKITISAEPSVISKDGLPTDSSEVEGSMAVTVRGDTTFTLTVKLEGKPDATAQASVTGSFSAGLDCSQFYVTTNMLTPVLEGEKVAISWSIPEMAKSAINAIRVTDSMGDGPVVDPKAMDHAEVSAKAGGYKVSFQAQGKDYCPTTVHMPVASLEELSRDKAVRVVQDASKPNEAYVGLDKGFNGGKIQLVHYDPISHAMEVDFFSALKGYDQLNQYLQASFMENIVKTFPVNAVASSANRLFVGTTGAVLYQDGDQWNILAPLRHRDYTKTYKAEGHDSCFGMKQSGKVAAVKGDITTLRQVCDMVATEDGKLYVATDQGLHIVDDVEAYIKDKNNKRWTNVAELKDSIVNDIEIVKAGNETAVLAAGSKGVYHYDAASSTWAPLNGGALGAEETGDLKPVYSIAAFMGYLGPVIAIYPPPPPSLIVAAGSQYGVYLKDVTAKGAWVKKSLPVSAEEKAGKPENYEKVYSIALDVNGLFVGSSSGLYVSRNGGESFESVATPLVTVIHPDGTTSTEAPVVRSISVSSDGDPATKANYTLYLATEQGLIRAFIPEWKMSAVVIDDDGLEGPVVAPVPAQPATPSATGTVTFY